MVNDQPLIVWVQATCLPLPCQEISKWTQGCSRLQAANNLAFIYMLNFQLPASIPQPSPLYPASLPPTVAAVLPPPCLLPWLPLPSPALEKTKASRMPHICVLCKHFFAALRRWKPCWCDLWQRMWRRACISEAGKVAGGREDCLIGDGEGGHLGILLMIISSPTLQVKPLFSRRAKRLESSKHEFRLVQLYPRCSVSPKKIRASLTTPLSHIGCNELTTWFWNFIRMQSLLPLIHNKC